MPESVNIVVGAKDEASANIAKAAASMEAFGKSAKESGKAIGKFNSLLGASVLANFAGGVGSVIGDLTELKEKFELLAEKSLLAKGAMFATAGVIGFQLGKALRDSGEEIQVWNRRLDEAIDKSKQLLAAQVELGNAQAAARLSAAKDLQPLTASIEERERLLKITDKQIKDAKSGLESLKFELRLLQTQALKLTEIETNIGNSQSRFNVNLPFFGGASAADKTLAQEAIEEQAKLLDSLRERRSLIAETLNAEALQKEREQEAAKVRERIDAERRQRAEAMWQREAEEHQKALDRADNLKKAFKDEIQAEIDALNADIAETRARQKAIAAEKRASFDALRAEILSRRSVAGSAPDIQAFQSRMLSRANRVDPIDKVAKNGELTNKELAEIRKLQQQQLEEARRANRDFERFETLGP